MCKEQALNKIRGWLVKLRDPENQKKQITKHFVSKEGVCALGLDEQIYALELSGKSYDLEYTELAKALATFGICFIVVAIMNDTGRSFAQIADAVESAIGVDNLYPKIEIKKELTINA
jgi:hypothetical protein